MGETRVQHQPESILIADCGSTITKVVLIDVVQGQYRFVAYADAPSTVNDPWDDVSIGLVHAMRQLEAIVNRPILDAEGHLQRPETPGGVGVDRFAAVSSAARPLRVVLAGVTSGISVASAQRATLHTYAEIVETVTLGGVTEQEGGSLELPRTGDELINAIWHASPDLLCIVGGTDDGAREPLLNLVRDVVRVALYLLGENLPTVIYAGNAALRGEISELIEEVAPVHVVDNVRPTPEVENIGPASEEIELCFYEQQLKYLPGGDVLRAWGSPAVLPTARTTDYTVRYCAHAWNPDKPALSVDIGSANVALSVCQGGRPLTAVRTDLGIGYSLRSLLDQVDVADILRWLPFALSPAEARDRLLNRALRPHSIAQTREEVLLEQAVVREAVRLALRDLVPSWLGRASVSAEDLVIPPCDPIIGGGGVLAHVPHQGLAALALIDALQPLGSSGLYLDEYDLLPTLGAIAQDRPLALVQSLRSGGLTYLGTVVSATGRGRVGETALTVRPAEGEKEPSFEVAHGTLRVLPRQTFALGTALELVPGRGIDIGAGPGKPARIVYRGGTVGLIVDTRGRPLPTAAEQLGARMDGWLSEIER
jgi:hypothetical protein